MMRFQIVQCLFNVHTESDGTVSAKLFNAAVNALVKLYTFHSPTIPAFVLSWFLSLSFVIKVLELI